MKKTKTYSPIILLYENPPPLTNDSFTPASNVPEYVTQIEDYDPGNIAAG